MRYFTQKDEDYMRNKISSAEVNKENPQTVESAQSQPCEFPLYYENDPEKDAYAGYCVKWPLTVYHEDVPEALIDTCNFHKSPPAIMHKNDYVFSKEYFIPKWLGDGQMRGAGRLCGGYCKLPDEVVRGEL